MSKVTLWMYSGSMVLLDCEHYLTNDGEKDVGDPVDCPVCAEIEKRVKAALERAKERLMCLDKHDVHNSGSPWYVMLAGVETVMDEQIVFEASQ